MPVFEPWPVERIDRARQMWDAGYSGGMIAAALGKTRNSILGLSRRQNWSRRGPDSPLKGLSRKRYQPRPRTKKPARKRDTYSYKSLFVLPRTPNVVKQVPVEPSRDTACTLLSLTARSCRWPVGESTGRYQLFCSATKDFDHTYCEYHRMQAYWRGTKSERLALKGIAA